MARIRVLLGFGIVFNVLVLRAEVRVDQKKTSEEIQNLFPCKWLIPQKYFPVIDPLIIAMPCIQNQKIKVKYKSLKTTMTSRPSFGSLFKSRKNRTYVIRINNNESFNGVLYKDVPSDAKTGLWAHELMHIKDYKSRNFFGVIFRGWQYLSKKGKIRFEHEIDHMVIEAGFADYLYQWSNFVLEESEACPSYKAFKRKIYLSACEIIGNCDDTIVEVFVGSN